MPNNLGYALSGLSQGLSGGILSGIQAAQNAKARAAELGALKQMKDDSLASTDKWHKEATAQRHAQYDLPYSIINTTYGTHLPETGPDGEPLYVNYNWAKELGLNQRKKEDIAAKDAMNKENNKTKIQVAGIGADKKQFKATALQENSIQQARAGANMLEGLGKEFMAQGFNKPTTGDAAAQLLKPIVGSTNAVMQRMNPKQAAYDALAEQVAEYFLRKATGAATNPGEVKAYRGYLPAPGDTPDIVPRKLAGFRNRIRDVANTSIKTIELTNPAKAQEVRDFLANDMAALDNVEAAFLGGGPAAPVVPGSKPPTGGPAAPVVPGAKTPAPKSLKAQILSDPNAGPDDIAWAKQQPGE